MPEEPKSCLNCGKADGVTGISCSDRIGCFTPNYDNWIPIGPPDEKKTGWEIISFLWDKSDDHIIINLKHKGYGVIRVCLSPDDIAGIALPGKLKKAIEC